MIFDPESFNKFPTDLSVTREQVDKILASSIGSNAISEASMILLWQSIYDTLMTTEKPEERLKFAGTIEKIFSALTARRAMELRENKLMGDATKDPLDAEAMNDLQHKLKLL